MTDTKKALEMAIEALEDAQKCLMGHLFLEKLPYVEAINACEEALEQPTQEPVATIQQFERKWIDKEALEQPAEPRLVSYALDGSTCTLNIDGEEVYFNREQPAQEPVKVYGILEDGDYISVEATKEGAIKVCEDMNKHDWNCTYKPLYTHPHQWQGLTDDEIQELTHYDIKFARAIEQSLREKNT